MQFSAILFNREDYSERKHLGFFHESHYGGAIDKAVEIYDLFEAEEKYQLQVNELGTEWSETVELEEYHNCKNHLTQEGAAEKDGGVLKIPMRCTECDETWDEVWNNKTYIRTSE